MGCERLRARAYVRNVDLVWALCRAMSGNVAHGSVMSYLSLSGLFYEVCVCNSSVSP